MQNSRSRRWATIHVLGILAFGLTVQGCVSTRVDHMPPSREGAPYSRAVRVGETLYLAGDGASHEDPVQEAHNLMRSVQSTLALEGMTLDDLVQVTVYCSDVSLYETFNEVYQSYFVDERPRSCVHRLGRVALGDALRAPGDSGQTLSSGNPRHARSRPTLPRPSLRSMV